MDDKFKKTILSVLGVMLLVIGVVRISFAFFNYIRTGEKNNQITSGKISFNFEDGQTLTLSNHFPMDGTGNGIGAPYTEIDQVCTFTITGSASTEIPISYKIYAVPGDKTLEQSGKTRLLDEEIFLNIKRTDTDPIGTFTGNSDYYGTSTAGITLNDGKLQLGTGTINPTEADDDAVMSFEVRIWVDSSKVVITDTPKPTETRRAYSTEQYRNLYYSMKILVEAEA